VCEGPTRSDLVKVIAGLFKVADRGDWEAVLSAYAPDAVLATADGVCVPFIGRRVVSPESTSVGSERTAMSYQWVAGMITRLITRPDPEEARTTAERARRERG
jgi:hypothetical protein